LDLGLLKNSKQLLMIYAQLFDAAGETLRQATVAVVRRRQARETSSAPLR